jgi:uncharacterized membrane protein YdjX (TVP38/TMEM64 family)
MKHYWLLAGAMMASFLALFGLAEWLQIPLLARPEPWLAHGGWIAAAVGVGLLVADVLLPVPASMVMIAHGALFGVGLGSLLSLAGALGAAWFGFAVGRRGGPLLARLVPEAERRRADALLQEWGGLAVLATRPVPILAETVAILAGASPMSWTRLTVSTLGGALPAALLYAITGATARNLEHLVLVFTLVLGVAALSWGIGRRFRMSRSTAVLAAVLFFAPWAPPALAAAESPCTPTRYDWKQGEAKKRLLSASPADADGGVCFLSRVSGRFEGSGESVDVWVADGAWWLSGGSKQAGVTTAAHCLPWRCLAGVGKLSSAWEARARWVRDQWDGCEQQEVFTLAGDAATYLSGFSGKLLGSGESVSIWQSSQPGKPSKLVAHSCQSYVRGSAYSLYPRQPGKPVRLLGPGAEEMEYRVSSEAGGEGKVAGEALMADAAQAVCYFTHLGGAFRSGDEVAEIALADAPDASGKKVWKLTAKSGGAGKPGGISARAACLAFEQP